MYMDKDLREYNLYQLIDQVNERKINYRDFYFELLDNIHLFYDGNGRTYNIPFVEIPTLTTKTNKTCKLHQLFMFNYLSPKYPATPVSYTFEDQLLKINRKK